MGYLVSFSLCFLCNSQVMLRKSLTICFESFLSKNSDKALMSLVTLASPKYFYIKLNVQIHVGSPHGESHAQSFKWVPFHPPFHNKETTKRVIFYPYQNYPINIYPTSLSHLQTYPKIPEKTYNISKISPIHPPHPKGSI